MPTEAEMIKVLSERIEPYLRGWLPETDTSEFLVVDLARGIATELVEEDVVTVNAKPRQIIQFNPHAPIPYSGPTDQYVVQIAPKERTTEELLKEISSAIRTQATHQRGGYPNETLLEVADAIDEVLG